MARETIFGGIIDFMQDIGVYDVILPFLLVFTIVYAILEKTQVLGVDIIDKVPYTRRNLNSVVAFVMGFLVIASQKLVNTVNESMGNLVLLLLVATSWLMLVGTFHTSKDPFDIKKSSWAFFFEFVMFIGVVLIFAHAIPTKNNESFLEWLLRFIAQNWDTNWVGAIILLLFVVGFMFYITQPEHEKKKPKDDD